MAWDSMLPLRHGAFPTFGNMRDREKTCWKSYGRKRKGKAITETGRGGTCCHETLKLQHFLDHWTLTWGTHTPGGMRQRLTGFVKLKRKILSGPDLELATWDQDVRTTQKQIRTTLIIDIIFNNNFTLLKQNFCIINFCRIFNIIFWM
jgi:hypothetical protein